MDAIIFEIGDTTIKMENGAVSFWRNGSENYPDIILPIDRLQEVLSTARMLIKNGDVTAHLNREHSQHQYP